MSRRLPLAAPLLGMVTAGSLSAQSLTPGPRYSVGVDPYAITKGDFNGDGRVDLAVANKSTIDISTLLGAGVGTFSSAIAHSVAFQPLANGPDSIAAADFNGDGVDDLVVGAKANGGSGGGSTVLLSLGNGHFVQTSAFAPSGDVESVLAADMNGDGYADIIYAPGSVVLGNGSGGILGSAAQVSSQFPRELTAGDVDLDGHLDIVLADWGNSHVYVFTKLTATGFGSTQVIFAGGPYWITGVALGDLDGDGLLDMVTANGEANTLSSLRGINGSFELKSTFNSGGTLPLRAAISDVNNDGMGDIVATNSSVGYALALIPGNGSATFPFNTPVVPIALAGNATDLVVADLNADASADIAATFLATNSVGTYFGDWLVFGDPIGTASYGVGTPGCSGPQELQANESPAIGSATFAIRCTNAPANGTGSFMFADVQDPVGTDTFGVGAELLVDLFASNFVLGINATANASGVALLAVPIPNQPSLVGGKVFAQTLWAWPINVCFNFPFGLSTSSGLEITIQP